MPYKGERSERKTPCKGGKISRNALQGVDFGGGCLVIQPRPKAAPFGTKLSRECCVGHKLVLLKHDKAVRSEREAQQVE